MSQLRAYLENYIHNLQTLKVQHSNDQDLLNAAEDKWGAEDPRFMILQERPKQQRWNSPPGQPKPEEPKPEDEPNEVITWLPGRIEIFQGLLKGVADDKVLVEEAEKKWGQESYEYLVVKQGLN